MKREDIYAKLYDLEFCEPAEKEAKERELNDIYKKACEFTGKPLYILKLALLKRYPPYRCERLRKELPLIPPGVRHQ